MAVGQWRALSSRDLPVDLAHAPHRRFPRELARARESEPPEIRPQPLIGQACVIGEARPFISALVVLDAEVAPGWAGRHGIEATSLLELADHPEVRAEVDREVATAMETFNSAESVKKVKILHAEWMPDSEELTPTMKLKRRGIYAKYIREIESLYS